MAGYKPLKILGPETGLVTEREEFLLPDDAYVELENMYVWHGRLRRKERAGLLARLRRLITSQAEANTDASPDATYDITDILSLLRATEPNAELEPGTVVLTIDAAGIPGVLTDDGAGGWVNTSGTYTADTSTSTINYSTGAIHIDWTAIPSNKTVTSDFGYHPGLPVMGIRQRETSNIGYEQTVCFDTKYAYVISGGKWIELASSTPTTWSGTDSDFMWSTNWFRDPTFNKLFWVTNFSGIAGDPIRYYDGTTWNDFADTGLPRGDIDGGSEFLWQSLTLAPFRGMLIACNTWEGGSLAGSTNYPNRVRYSQIGNPLLPESFRDDIPGKGGFIDVPTSEQIVTAGFVRDNYIIQCERSSWQLRFTGISSAPLQLDRINTELGATGTFSTVQFETEIVSFGGRGIVSCDSFKTTRIDDKIQNFIFDRVQNDESGPQRVHGIRDFTNRLAYWTYPTPRKQSTDPTRQTIRFPNKRLVYNYEEDSWAIFEDSYTTVGYFYETSNRTWASSVGTTWAVATWPWTSVQSQFPMVVGGNQQGFILKLIDPDGYDRSLAISAIDGTVSPIRITVNNHNFINNDDGDQIPLIRISGIPTGSGFYGFNGNVYGAKAIDQNTLDLFNYISDTDSFVGIDSVAETYSGYGRCSPVENFKVVSKQFNMMENGQKIQLGYVDVLAKKTASGEITMKLYTDFAKNKVSNDGSDSFFNTKMTTAPLAGSLRTQDKLWHRVHCTARATMIQIEWTLSTEQLVTSAQTEDVQIDAQILWVRNAGRLI